MPEPQPSTAGFTLLELLVTMALLGLLTMVMFGGMRFGAQVWARTGTDLTDANTARIAEELIQAELSRAYPLYTSEANAAQIAFDGDKQRIRYLAPSRDRPGMMERVALEADGDEDTVDLVRTASAELTPSAESRQSRLLTHIGGVMFSYFGTKQDGDRPVWSDTWRQRTRLPLLIRVTIKAKNGTARTFLVAPRLAADVGCVFDALTNGCRGR